MTTDLKTKLNTAGAFDPAWLQKELRCWNAAAEQKTADFMEHIYQCSGRHVPGHPMHGLYTGLWTDFCVREAGPVMRERYFEMLEAIRLYEQGLLEPIS